MSSPTIKSNTQLNSLAISIADDIIDDARLYGGAEWVDTLNRNHVERVHEAVDGSEYIIYYHHAKAICCNCDVSQGEDVADPMDQDGEFIGFDRLAAQIAYYELISRVMQVMNLGRHHLSCEDGEVAA
tara:strand:- start:421 stop:804 length:384 start_codon:yes stop_codon:yes gene_type:complete